MIILQSLIFVPLEFPSAHRVDIHVAVTELNVVATCLLSSQLIEVVAGFESSKFVKFLDGPAP